MLSNFGDILGLGVPELVVILVILLILFGGKKLPELARSIGSSVKELRDGVSESSQAKNDTKTKTDEA
ncbi:MAG: twin-arginine translocase TatA/TatE family subunit [Candidatus Woesebacteria bacterium]|jgi:sec-independent protein translocase protein TatA